MKPARERLGDALLALNKSGETTPCHRDPRFTSDHAADRAEAKALCATCPVVKLCREVGREERDGVYGGIDRSLLRLPRRHRQEAAA